MLYSSAALCCAVVTRLLMLYVLYLLPPSLREREGGALCVCDIVTRVPSFSIHCACCSGV